MSLHSDDSSRDPFGGKRGKQDHPYGSTSGRGGFMGWFRRRGPREPFTVCACCRASDQCPDCREWRANNVEHTCNRYA